MAWIRQLPSGLWAATVRTPAGRITETRRLKGQVEAWARDLESDVARGDFIDPRSGDATVGQMWDRARDAKRLEMASRRRDQSHWRNHVEPKWARTPVGGILRPDVSAWVVQMERAGIGAATIQGSVGVLRGLLELAVDARLIRENPARGVRMPKRKAHVDRVLSADEDALLLESLDRQFPGRPDGRLFVELMLYCGLRYEEAAAVCRTHLDMRRQLINVGPVLERDGTIRPYPKSPAGERPVPVPEDVWPRLREHALSVRPGKCTDDPPGGLLFGGARGVGPLHYSSWLRRVWQRGLFEVTQRGKRGVVIFQRQILDDPQPTPHDLRHTFGTRLGDAGLGVHEIMSLMGHETLESAQRYLHAGEDRFDRARAALARARGL